MRLLWVALVLAGCDDGTSASSDPIVLDRAVMDAQVVDAAVDMVMDAEPDQAPPACAVQVDGPIAVLEGSIAQVAAVTEGEPEVRFEGEGASAAWLVDGQLHLKAGYGEAGMFAGTLIATCGAVSAEVPITIERRSMGFEAGFEWTDDGPPGREYFSMWIDPQNPDALWVFGGFHYEPRQFTVAADLWRLDIPSGQWTAVDAPDAPLRAGGGMAFRPGERTGFLYGGLTPNNTIPFAFDQLTYDDEGARWTAVEMDDRGQGTYQPAVFFDARRDRFLALGGQGLFGTHVNLHAFRPQMGRFLPVPTGEPRPVGRTGFFWAYDPQGDRVVLFSGEQGGEGWDCHCDDQTWALYLDENPPRWALLDEGGGPEPRRNGIYTYDPYGHRMLLWGGTPDGQNSGEGLWAFDFADDTWHRLNLATDAPPRSSGAAVIDAARGRMLAGFGNGARVYQDLWSLPLTLNQN
jgi:hypothetical protein